MGLSPSEKNSLLRKVNDTANEIAKIDKRQDAAINTLTSLVEDLKKRISSLEKIIEQGVKKASRKA